MILKHLNLLTLVILFCAGNIHAQWSIKGTKTDKNARWNHIQFFSDKDWNSSNFASEKDMKWFNDARYGMFIHFGLSTYIKKDLSWGMCYTRKAPDGGHGPIADSVWVTYPEQFEFKNFDAKKWVQIAKDAGMKYIVTIAKHHDGFHMWDTKYSDFKVTNTPFGRDYLKEIADACHEANMKFGIYYSQRDWYHPDYAPIDTSLVVRQNEAPYYRPKPEVDKVLPGPTHEKYKEYQFNVVRELCTNYGKVDVFWFDASWWGGMFTADMWDSEALTRMIRELQPGIIINNRASIPGDFDTPEQKIGMYQERPWESCITLTHSWSYSDTPPKSKENIIKMITSTACGNGNMLLSWGSKWDGAFDQDEVERLEEVGKWMKSYGQSIYNTKGGPWYPQKWGGSTYQNKTIYLHITNKSLNSLKLPGIASKIKKAKVLTGGEISFTQNKSEIVFNLSEVNKTEETIIIELTCKKTITGMFGSELSNSLFSDPSYGNIISNNATFTLSSQSDEDDSKFHSLLFSNKLFNSPFAFHTKEEKESYTVVDLGKNYTVKGVDIFNQKHYLTKDLNFSVLISKDGNNWKKVEDKKGSFYHWEVPVTQFNAGIELPGVETRFIKIVVTSSNPAALHLKKIQVYGTDIDN
ncbi:alpha-L-fucosidase [Aestuariibaculum sediminum]|uniref:alpha-L-fucosidase n=1 Tax=Aestuariibaculum sediminum TaxID=2770637 RepID=A0A8J6Q076_9FLAO|nr:alpha-L-fucosidase [Aestuariibaculum sediminum]MBD0832928.1 alpha-L-fucosidase [Aestuariibaculum sediminum]